jgi:curved DNA-binding protein CbpA
MKNVYDLLGIRPDADDETVKKAYRDAAKLHHPDHHPDDADAALRFSQIAAAYAVLRDADQRAGYDQLLALERRRIRSAWTRIISEAIFVAVLSSVLVMGYIWIEYIVSTPLTTDRVERDAVRGPIETAAVQPPRPPDATGGDGSGDKREGIAERVSEPSGAAPATNDAGVSATADDGPAPLLLPNEAEFYRERGLAAYRSGDVHRAIADLDQAIRRDPNDAKAYTLRGNAWNRLGASDRALADYDEAIRIDPNNPAAFHDRGMLWRRKGDLNRALVDLDRAIRFGFSDANFYNDRGLIWYERGSYLRAIADFDRASKIDPNFAAPTINRDIALHPNLSP